MASFFSIVVPVYNVATYLRECLDSVKGQTFRDWECICVDDGSSDGSGTILDEYALADKRFVVVHSGNQGVATARNTAMRLATGRWIGFLDSDDSWDSKWLEVAYSVISDFANADLVHMKVCDSADDTTLDDTTPKGYCLSKCHEGPAAFRWGLSAFSAFGVLWLCFIRRAVLYGRFLSGLSYKEDSIFLIGCLKNIRAVVDCGFKGYHYRMVAGSLSKKIIPECHCVRYLASCGRLWREYEEYAKSIGCIDELRNTLRHMADHDIIEWAMRRSMSVLRGFRVRRAYARLRRTGALESRFNDQKRFRIPFHIWFLTGSTVAFWILQKVQDIKDRISRCLLRRAI